MLRAEHKRGSFKNCSTSAGETLTHRSKSVFESPEMKDEIVNSRTRSIWAAYICEERGTKSRARCARGTEKNLTSTSSGALRCRHSTAGARLRPGYCSSCLDDASAEAHDSGLPSCGDSSGGLAVPVRVVRHRRYRGLQAEEQRKELVDQSKRRPNACLFQLVERRRRRASRRSRWQLGVRSRTQDDLPRADFFRASEKADINVKSSVVLCA